ncbi:hypothetical protein DLL90_15130 [Salmonella enterica subsp. enterica serovar Arechavaleta]|nr:hypothetical protein [Salmonella enterica subsp. enterica serovar Arechavaleta]EBI3941900.1 hypothetical protein [Salmonella enterica]EBL2098521.1 hypothetical protein [Salmonella enterica]EBO6756600.1 hypothetical protein [Salmonella enterica]EBS0916905.1 hypothetical protein [Salmonella enterica subsp. enterica serovar Arechavaleta]
MNFVFQDFRMGNLTKHSFKEMSYLSVKKAKNWKRRNYGAELHASSWLPSLKSMKIMKERLQPGCREYCFSEAQKVTSKLKLRNR